MLIISLMILAKARCMVTRVGFTSQITMAFAVISKTRIFYLSRQITLTEKHYLVLRKQKESLVDTNVY